MGCCSSHQDLTNEMDSEIKSYIGRTYCKTIEQKLFKYHDTIHVLPYTKISHSGIEGCSVAHQLVFYNILNVVVDENNVIRNIFYT